MNEIIEALTFYSYINNTTVNKVKKSVDSGKVGKHH